MADAAVELGLIAETTVFMDYFNELPDHRQPGKVIYPLNEVLLLSLLAVLAGAETFCAIARFGEKKLALLRRFLPFSGLTNNLVEGRQSKQRWTAKTAAQMKSTVDLLIGVAGHDDFTLLPQRDAAIYRDTLQKLPIKFGKSSRDRTNRSQKSLPRPEICPPTERAATPRRSTATSPILAPC